MLMRSDIDGNYLWMLKSLMFEVCYLIVVKVHSE